MTIKLGFKLGEHLRKQYIPVPIDVTGAVVEMVVTPRTGAAPAIYSSSGSSGLLTIAGPRRLLLEAPGDINDTFPQDAAVDFFVRSADGSRLSLESGRISVAGAGRSITYTSTVVPGSAFQGPAWANDRFEWVPGPYLERDGVTHNNSYYIALVDTEAEPGGNSDWWRVMNGEGALADREAAQAAAGVAVPAAQAAVQARQIVEPLAEQVQTSRVVVEEAESAVGAMHDAVMSTAGQVANNAASAEYAAGIAMAIQAGYGVTYETFNQLDDNTTAVFGQVLADPDLAKIGQYGRSTPNDPSSPWLWVSGDTLPAVAARTAGLRLVAGDGGLWLVNEFGERIALFSAQGFEVGQALIGGALLRAVPGNGGFSAFNQFGDETARMDHEGVTAAVARLAGAVMRSIIGLGGVEWANQFGDTTGKMDHEGLSVGAARIAGALLREVPGNGGFSAFNQFGDETARMDHEGLSAGAARIAGLGFRPSDSPDTLWVNPYGDIIARENGAGWAFAGLEASSGNAPETDIMVLRPADQSWIGIRRNGRMVRLTHLLGDVLGYRLSVAEARLWWVQAGVETNTKLVSELTASLITKLKVIVGRGQSNSMGAANGGLTSPNVSADPSRALSFSPGYRVMATAQNVATLMDVLSRSNCETIVAGYERTHGTSGTTGYMHGSIKLLEGRPSTEAVLAFTVGIGGQSISRWGWQGRDSYPLIKNAQLALLEAAKHAVLADIEIEHRYCWISALEADATRPRGDIKNDLIIDQAGWSSWCQEVFEDAIERVSLLRQISNWTAGISEAPQATLDLAIAQPTKFICAGPTFQHPYDSDHVHLSPVGQAHDKEIMAVYQRRHEQGLDALPYRIISHSLVGNILTLTYGGWMGGDVVFDTSVVSDPGNWGIAVSVDLSGAVGITDMGAVDDTIVIELAAAPVGANPSVTVALQSQSGAAAGPTTGARAPIRSSVSMGTHFDGTPMYAYACHQNYPLV